jgi:hypothetical protein
MEVSCRKEDIDILAFTMERLEDEKRLKGSWIAKF